MSLFEVLAVDASDNISHARTAETRQHETIDNDSELVLAMPESLLGREADPKMRTLLTKADNEGVDQTATFDPVSYSELLR